MTRIISQREAYCWMLAVAGVLCAAAVASGQQPSIVGPKSASPGDLVVLDASSYDAEQYRWLLVNSTKTFLPVEDNTKLVFSSGQQGRYLFVLVAARLVDGKLKVATAEHALTIGDGPQPGPTPPVPPGPQPTPPGPIPPTPTPTPPDGYNNLTRFAYDTAIANVPAGSRNHAAGIGINYRSIASQVAAGTIPGPASAVEAVKKLNQQTAGNDRNDWMAFFTLLASKMTTDGDDVYRNKDNLSRAFRAIADGLEAVPKVQGLAKSTRATHAAASSSSTSYSRPIIRYIPPPSIRSYEPIRTYQTMPSPSRCYIDAFGRQICN